MEWFSGLELEEIQPLMDFVFAPFSHITSLAPATLFNKSMDCVVYNTDD